MKFISKEETDFFHDFFPEEPTNIILNIKNLGNKFGGVKKRV